MEWSVGSDESQGRRVETEVLDMLRPHKNLEELHIKCYLGTGFPTSMGDPLFSNMLCISLQNCKKCVSLPPLGQLPLLKDLCVEGMSALKHVSYEFYGLCSTKPFPLLETLSFKNMPEWEEWYTFGDSEEVLPFNRVCKLSIENCPKLLGMLPCNLPCLKNLEITECPQLLVEASTIFFPSLTSIVMKDVSLTSLLVVLEMRNMVEDEVMLANASSVTSLSIGIIKKLELLPKWFTHGLMKREELNITSCEELKTLWKNDARLQHSHPAFRSLEINGWPQLVSLLEEDEDEENEGQHQQQQEGLSCIVRLDHIKIDNCGKLEKLPRRLHTFNFLRELHVYQCSSLSSFPEAGFPSMLKTLVIRDCKALQSIFGWVKQINDSNLEVLEVHDCPSLTCLISCRGGQIPPTLKKVEIWECKKLEALLVEEGMKINCPSLEYFAIWYCDKLKYLPDVVPNDNNLRNLIRLMVHGCNNLESIPEGWFRSATNLRILAIPESKKLKALPLLPHQLQTINYLTSLHWLQMNISHWNNNVKQIGWHNLPSLRTLSIRGPICVAEEEEEEEDRAGSNISIDEMLLPASLIDLRIHEFPNLKKLSSKVFQNLSSLQFLAIIDCPRLESIPVKSLSPSLLRLWIQKSPRLARKCEKGKGQYWPHLAYLADVQVVNK